MSGLSVTMTTPTVFFFYPFCHLFYNSGVTCFIILYQKILLSLELGSQKKEEVEKEKNGPSHSSRGSPCELLCALVDSQSLVFLATSIPSGSHNFLFPLLQDSLSMEGRDLI